MRPLPPAERPLELPFPYPAASPLPELRLLSLPFYREEAPLSFFLQREERVLSFPMPKTLPAPTAFPPLLQKELPLLAELFLFPFPSFPLQHPAERYE